MTAVRTPLNTGQALALGGDAKRYRKQLLKAGPLHYQGGVVDISPEMIGGIVEAFDAKAQTRVPFQLADTNNAHTMDPERRRGFVTALHQTPEGLDGIIELEDAAAAIVDSDPEFGVSVLVSPVETGEGAQWPAVLQHVLGTYSPVVTTLAPWSVAASQKAPDDLIDFLALSAEDNGQAPATKPTEVDVTRLEKAVADATSALEQARTAAAPAASETTAPPSEGATADPSEGTDDAMPSLAELLDNASEDELKAFRMKLDAVSPAMDDTAGEATEAVDDLTGDPEVTDDELAEAEAILEDLDLTGDPEQGDDNDEDSDDSDEDESGGENEQHAVAASQVSTDNDDRLALANAQIGEQGIALAQMRRELDDAKWREDRDALITANVPPALVELAKPFLHGSDQRLALSQDGQAKAAAQVRKMLTEVSGLMKTLRLGQPAVGTSLDASAEAEKAAADEARTSAVRAHITSSGMAAATRTNPGGGK